MKGDLDMANYATMKKDELVKLAAEKGLEADGKTKAEIIAMIEESENVAEPAETAPEKVEDPMLKALREQNEMLQKQMEQLQAAVVSGRDGQLLLGQPSRR